MGWSAGRSRWDLRARRSLVGHAAERGGRQLLQQRGLRLALRLRPLPRRAERGLRGGLLHGARLPRAGHPRGARRRGSLPAQRPLRAARHQQLLLGQVQPRLPAGLLLRLVTRRRHHVGLFARLQQRRRPLRHVRHLPRLRRRPGLRARPRPELAGRRRNGPEGRALLRALRRPRPRPRGRCRRRRSRGRRRRRPASGARRGSRCRGSWRRWCR